MIFLKYIFIGFMLCIAFSLFDSYKRKKSQKAETEYYKDILIGSWIFILLWPILVPGTIVYCIREYKLWRKEKNAKK